MGDEKPQTGTGRCVLCEVSQVVGPLLQSLGGSENVSEHFRASRLEFLKGVRAMLDERIEKMSHEPRKGARIVVE